jgi:CheY-like chemotaxis protein
MPRILIAEDDSAIRQLLTTILQRNGFTVHTANDGTEVLRLIVHHEFDVLLLDLMMPNLSGWNVLTELERLKHPLVQKVVVITAASDKDIETVPPTLRLLRKPFDISELVTILRELTGQVETPLFVTPPSAIAEA